MIQSITNFLKEHYPQDLLMPVYGTCPPDKCGEKQPRHRHKDGQWSWAQLDAFQASHPSHMHYAILLRTLCVIDFDSHELHQEWEARFPEMLTAPLETTSKGRHYFFRRSTLADKKRFFDGTKQVPGREDLPIDFKTWTSKPCTAGLLVISPSGRRRWVRSPLTHPLEVISDSLLEAVATPGGKGKSQKTRKGSSAGAAKLARYTQDIGDRRDVASGSKPSVGKCSLALLTSYVEAFKDSRISNYQQWLVAVFGISNVSKENGYVQEGRALAHIMSKRAGLYEEEAVEAKFWEANRGLCDNPVGVRSLKKWAEKDSPGAEGQARINAVSAAFKRKQHHLKANAFMEEDEPHSDESDWIGNRGGDGEKLSKVVGAILKKMRPDIFAKIQEETFSAVPEKGRTLRLLDPNIGMNLVILYPTCSIIDDKLPSPSQICNLVPVEIKNMHDACNRVGVNTQLQLTRGMHGDTDVCELLNMDPKGQRVSYTIRDAFTSKPGKPSLQVDGRTVAVSKSQVKEIISLITTQSSEQLAAVMGATASTWFQLVTINNVFNLVETAEDDAHTSLELIQAMLTANTDIASRIVHAPNAKGKMFNMFYCDPRTNVWELEDHIVLEKLVVDALLAQREHLTRGDIKKLEGETAFRLLHTLAKECSDKAFLQRLDSNPNLFALTNGVFDMTSKTFRPLMVKDYVSITAGWSYDQAAALEHRGAVEEFCRQVLPIDEERAVVLAYFASLMSAQRRILVFTYERKGANEKSTFFKLLQHLFGAYAVSSSKFFGKPKFEQSREQHGGGTENFKGKRLVVAEELKRNAQEIHRRCRCCCRGPLIRKGKLL